MFLTRLELFSDPEPDYWVTGSELIWSDPIFGRIVVPIGFRTDLASVPRVLRNLPWFDPDGVSRRPAVVHDYLYSSAWGARRGRSWADEFLRRAMIREGAKPLIARLYWAGVRLGGQSHWQTP